MTTLDPARCSATNRRTGKQCGKPPIKGGSVCFQHGGQLPAVKKKAAVRAEVMRWGLDSPDVDPGETLLALVSQSRARVEAYGREIARMVAERDTLRGALTGGSYTWDEDSGETVKTGEYIRAMVELESEERDRCARLCKIALDAGIREREVQAAERQGAMLAMVLQRVFGDERLGLSAAQRDLALSVLDFHVGQLMSAPAVTGAPARG